MSDVRVKVVESLLRALIFFLQQEGHLADDRDSEVPPFFHDFALLIRRYHHYPVYYFAEKLGMTSAELNNKCKLHSGISAAEWISQYVLLEAKDLLIKTRLRSSRIAMMLNFSNYDTKVSHPLKHQLFSFSFVCLPPYPLTVNTCLTEVMQTIHILRPIFPTLQPLQGFCSSLCRFR